MAPLTKQHASPVARAPSLLTQVVMQSHMSVDPSLLDSILSSLAKAGLHERAGELYEYLGRSQEALMAFRKGHAYRCECKRQGACPTSGLWTKARSAIRDAIAGIHLSTCAEGRLKTNQQHPEARAEIHFGFPDWFGSSSRVPLPLFPVFSQLLRRLVTPSLPV